ncbi:MAG: AIR synthase-related protein, partial [Bacteroidia bacterium]|nr:AIR synthase-related protein [Bacteroidia bacterium]
IKINMKKVPLIGDVYNLIDDGCIPGASFRNLEFAENDTLFAPDLDYNLKMIAFDAQTSGGLLFCAPPDKVDKIMADLQDTGLRNAKVIGYVTEPEEKLIYLNN